MAGYNRGTPALNNVGAYQVSGRPYFKGGLIATTSVKVIEFPSVTTWIHIRSARTASAADAPLVAFSENGFTTNNYFTMFSSAVVSDTDPIVFPVKVTKIYYKSASGNQIFDLVAGLSNISTGSIQDNWSGSSGVG